VPSQTGLAAGAALGAGCGLAATGFSSPGAGWSDHGIFLAVAGSGGAAETDAPVSAASSTDAGSVASACGAGWSDHGILSAGADPDRGSNPGIPEPATVAVEGCDRRGVRG